MSSKRVLIIGATSAIAEAIGRLYAMQGGSLYLIARDAQRVQAIADDLRLRGAETVDTDILDVTNYAAHGPVIERAVAVLRTVDVAVIAHGTLPAQRQCEVDFEYALCEFSVNASATIALSGRVAQALERQGSGTLVVISSVAGDRGRASNCLYGAAKAAVSTYLSGLRQRLQAHHVNVLTVKPGFVDTPMTASFKKGVLWATPQRVARGVVRAVDQRRAVVYLPWFWRPVMFAVRAIPEAVFRRLKL